MRQRRRILVFFLLIIILILIYIFLLSRPAIGQISTSKSTHPAIDYGQKQFTGKLFDFTYDGSLKTLEYVAEPSGLYLEKINLTASQPLSRKISINVRKYDETSYTEIPDIKDRRLKKDIYTEEPFKVNGRNGLKFTRTDSGFEETVFLPRSSDTVASISLTSPELGRQDELEKEWQQLTKSFVLR